MACIITSVRVGIHDIVHRGGSSVRQAKIPAALYKLAFLQTLHGPVCAAPPVKGWLEGGGLVGWRFGAVTFRQLGDVEICLSLSFRWYVGCLSSPVKIATRSLAAGGSAVRRGYCGFR